MKFCISAVIVIYQPNLILLKIGWYGLPFYTFIDIFSKYLAHWIMFQANVIATNELGVTFISLTKYVILEIPSHMCMFMH
jgi:hypothetical protein